LSPEAPAAGRSSPGAGAPGGRDRETAIRSFLAGRGWLPEPAEVSFLAAGEYNENWAVRAAGGRYVFRINHGSQLGLDDQIEYEYRVLRHLAPSGVTPRPFACSPSPGELGGGVLLMEFVEGVPFDYRKDLRVAAAIFAAVHTLGRSAGAAGPSPGAAAAPEGLIVQNDPVIDIARESTGLIERFPRHALKRERDALLRYRDRVLDLARSTRGVFEGDPFCVVNTEVNSGNFIVHGESGHLVDWEKAVFSSRYQDLGHFVAPTTTLWKSDFRFTREEKRTFLDAYRLKAGLDLPLRALEEGTGILERTILLRAMSWCYMAYHEYTVTGRPLADPFTFARIEMYLKEMEGFFGLYG
jgi:aminoglycoside phosphotransferase (APT) family kinase protein